MFIAYQAKMHGLELPDLNNLGLERKGWYGDSFGALTSLFTGLAFAGLIVTILLQHNELKAQSSEFIDMNKNHEESIKLQSMNILYDVYQNRLDKNDILKRDFHASLDATYGGNTNAIDNENSKLIKNRDFILNYLENKIEGIDPTRK